MEQLTPNFQLDDDDVVAGLCGDSASMPRVFVAQYGYPDVPQSRFGQCRISEDIQVPPTNCTESDMRM